ncbi:uncharacterized protein LOC105253581 [Camponotus floridanus]|uniref:uncharacterized protein LOC105253581 n=1 Tax=Camponotus floridanus TaxID=104421 RepID=UPI000DC6CBA0|nr:uncharacterized protein LOC105253581 [Camponotus floridanus]
MVITREDGPSTPTPVSRAASSLLQLQGQPAPPVAVEQAPVFYGAGAEVSRVGMRVPEFTPVDPELWFKILDRSFQAAGITTDATKFGYAIIALGSKYSVEVRDVIINPPAEQAYETLRAELIKRLSLSQEHKTRRLLEHEEIGDRKPSQFLRHLRALAGNVVGDGILRTVWLSRLPAHIQPHLVTRTADTLDQLADIADAIVEATRTPVFQVAEAARAPAMPGDAAGGIAAIEAKINVQLAQIRLTWQQEMQEQLGAIRRSIEVITAGGSGDRGADGGRRRERYRSRSRSRSRTRDRGHSSNGLCWYHWRWGPNAHQCAPPCEYRPAHAGNASADR